MCRGDGWRGRRTRLSRWRPSDARRLRPPAGTALAPGGVSRGRRHDVRPRRRSGTGVCRSCIRRRGDDRSGRPGYPRRMEREDGSMLEQLFPGESEMARRMREADWASTPLGPVEQWPQSLQAAVRICLGCAFPIVIWWGPELAILYNDEYRPMLGPAKHPAALGEPGAKVWGEIWDVIGPMLSSVVERGEATRSRDLLLHIDRHGY